MSIDPVRILAHVWRWLPGRPFQKGACGARRYAWPSLPLARLRRSVRARPRAPGSTPPCRAARRRRDRSRGALRRGTAQPDRSPQGRSSRGAIRTPTASKTRMFTSFFMLRLKTQPRRPSRSWPSRRSRPVRQRSIETAAGAGRANRPGGPGNIADERDVMNLLDLEPPVHVRVTRQWEPLGLRRSPPSRAAAPSRWAAKTKSNDWPSPGTSRS